MLSHVQHLLTHAEWADAVFYETWGKTVARDNEDIRRRADHMCDVLFAFSSMLNGGPPLIPRAGPSPTFYELRGRAHSAHLAIQTFASHLTDEDLKAIVRIPFFPEPPCEISIADGLVQVAMHTQHHRGQQMTRLKDHGGEPKNVDYIIWLWKQKPNADWDM
jgi:uncharacterized damage-inducible protein DinB